MLLLFTLLPLLQDASDGPTTVIGKAFIDDVMVARDFDAARYLADEDMLFTDPTAHTMGMALADGIRGRDEILAKMQSFDVGKVVMTPRYQFSAGAYHCFVGTFSAQSLGAPAPTEFPFMTVLQIEEERVVERLDFGDYDPYIPEDRRVDGVDGDLEHPMVKAAKAYIEAYARRDIKAMASSHADDVVFRDRTAEVIGSGDAIEGKPAVGSMFESALGSLSSFGIETDYMFFHGDFAVFAGQLSYSLPGAQLGITRDTFSVTHPIAIVLQFADGKIIRHDDFCDYASFQSQLKAAR